jgi:16S rRNA (guanine527-N7)-methyltransferase
VTTPLGTAVEARLDALQSRYSLTADARASLASLLVLLAADALAPTTVTRPADAVDQHIADALVALDLPEVRAATAIADLGSGAGFPGIVLAIARPDATVSLVESNGRKCAFLARAITVAGVGNAVAVNARAETWVDGRGAHDIVTARAMAPLSVVAEYAAPLLRTGGTLVAWTGKRELQLEDQATRAASVLGLSAPTAVATAPFPGAQHRNLHLMSKLTDTPGQYPRRPGMARKRPLGALSGKGI